MNPYRIAALLLLVAMVGCDPQDCSLGYDAGEKFRVTIKGMLFESDPPCEPAGLSPGDSFTLTADSSLREVPGTNGCHSRPATGDVPPFSTEIVTECEPSYGQLGVACQGVLSDGCRVEFSAGVAPNFARGVKVIEDGLLTMHWNSVREACALLSKSCVSTQYAARIERLPRQETSN